MDRIQVAIVEDNRQFLTELETLLAEVPLISVVGIYTTGEAALHKIRQVQPDVALIDLGLPGVSGIDVIQALVEPECRMDCLVLTTYDDDAHLFAALEAGAVGYIVKDETSVAELVRAIQEVRSGGAPMSLGIARRVLEVFRTHTQQASNPSLAELTAREREVLEYRGQGMSTRKVAQLLHISYETVRRHQKAIYEKLHVHSIVEAVAALNATTGR